MSGSSKILLGFILGSMMSVDMGGPFNKAAYVFGTASIAAGNYDIMAAVMIGGMVPPCAIALATLLLKISLQKKKDSPVRSTSLWVWHSSQRARSRMQRPIRSTYCLPASSAQEFPAHFPRHFNVL